MGIATALSEADGIDYTDPEEVLIIKILFFSPSLIECWITFLVSYTIIFFHLEQLEMLIATLIDLDAMDGKRSASLLAECSSSPDENTRYVFNIHCS